MEALILSCSTGGGHNAAGKAVAEAFEARGHHVTLMDPYQLASDGLAATIGNMYIKLVQKVPCLFGFIYFLGSMVRRFPGHSPVYWINGKMTERMREYLQQHSFDVIVMPHIFPAEILSHLKNDGVVLPATIFVATDYACIPFTEETACDYYVIPSAQLKEEFCGRGIAEEKIVPLGIPVRSEFVKEKDRDAALKKLGLSKDKRYLLLSGGSIGAGKIASSIRCLRQYLKENRDCRLVVICGNNLRLYRRLKKKYETDEQLLILQSTPHIADYMKACDVFLSKPGGLSSTEAAVLGIPLVHISPIPGCEKKNAAFFAKREMSVPVTKPGKELLAAIERFEDARVVERMRENQEQYINPQASVEICQLAESLAEGERVMK